MIIKKGDVTILQVSISDLQNKTEKELVESDNSGNSPQVAAPRRPREINQSMQRCSLLDQIHTLSCTKQK